MRAKTWALFIAAPSLFILNTTAWAASSLKSPDFPRQPHWMSLNVELAGADETDAATDKQLKDSGVEMVPSENLKKAQPLVTEPIVEKTMPEKPSEKPMAMPVQTEPEPTPKVNEDMGTTTPINSTPSANMSHVVSGPYLRIDLGYGFNMNPDGTQSAGNLSSESVANSVLAGGGIGYRFNENMRGDMTFTYRPDADVSATTVAANTTSSEISALSVMLNAYWDITTTHDFTPYIGAGFGYAHLSTSDQTTTGGVATETGATSDNFAWSLTAGTAYKLFDNMLLDMNYRFINMGEFAQDVSTSYEDLMAHEVRTGLRFIF